MFENVELKDSREIKELTSRDFKDTKRIPDGYEWTSIPEATPENMVTMMNKINELTKVVNSMLNERIK